MAVTILSMALVFAAPFIDMLVWLGGARWLGAYLVVVALAMVAVAAAVVVVGLAVPRVGARRARSISQIIAAVVGAAFAIGIQFAAIVSFGTIAVPRFAVLERLAPGPDNALLLASPRRARRAGGAGSFGRSHRDRPGRGDRVFAPRFGQLALAASGVSQGAKKISRSVSRFRSSSPAQALRRKEWTLLLRDPWLMSQTLMQLLYLLPAAFLLWRSFYAGAASRRCWCRC